MASKITIVFAILFPFYFKTISSQVITNNNLKTLASTSNLANPMAADGPKMTSGVFMVSSTSPIYPSGISVLADNIVIEGQLAVSGQLPYLGTIGFEGSLGTSGQGIAKCGCGDGNVGMISEGLANGGLATGNLGTGLRLA